MKKNILNVKNLTVQIQTLEDLIQPVDKLSFQIKQGEIFALVGESGCGKSITSLALNRLLPNNAFLCEGSEIWLNETTALHQLSETQMQKIRAKEISMIFQDPGLALNPVLTIEQQLLQALKAGNGDKNKNYRAVMTDLLKKVEITDAQNFLEKYPHQLSGGLKQRVMISMALCHSPKLLIADEPTTALDVTTQAQVLALLKELGIQYNMAILLITHDLGVVADMADNIAVMYAGHFVEQASKIEFFKHPKHPYSKKLLAAQPNHVQRNAMLATIPGQVPLLDRYFPLCRFKSRCNAVLSTCELKPPRWLNDDHHYVRCHWYDKDELSKLPKQFSVKLIENSSTDHLSNVSQENDNPVVLEVNHLKVYFPIQRGILKRTVGYVKAVEDVSFKVYEGKTLGLVGESGSGKTTVAKAILRLIEPTFGQALFLGQDLFLLSKRKMRAIRSSIQLIFQDPYASMNPRMTIHDILEEGMQALNIGSDANERQDRIKVLLEQVGLPSSIKSRFAHQLSGGQRQRIAIARALAVGAQLLVCDEPTSALDLSVQAQILNLLKNLQNELGISYLFISHNLSVVKNIADDLIVMQSGKIVEYGTVDKVLNAPEHPYTQQLLACVPTIQNGERFHLPNFGVGL